MNDLFLCLCTLLAAVAGALAAKMFRLPAPYMVGSMLGAAVLNVFTAQAFLPADTKIVTQSLTGVFIGMTLRKSDLLRLRDLTVPLAVMLTGFLIFTAVSGFTFYYLFKFDAATAFLISIPGGITEIALIAPEFGADSAVVSFLQTFRLFSVYLFFPAIIKTVSHKVPAHHDGFEERETAASATFFDKLMPDNDFLQQFFTAVVGLVGGVLGKLSGFPAATLAGSLMLTIVFQFNCRKAHLDGNYRKYVQIVAGALVGSSITMETVRHLNSLILPTIALVAMYIMADFVLSHFMTKTNKIDYVSSMFAAAPGGASDMALVAGEIGSDSPKIALLHIVRLISCYTIFPLWAKLLIWLVTGGK